MIIFLIHFYWFAVQTVVELIGSFVKQQVFAICNLNLLNLRWMYLVCCRIKHKSLCLLCHSSNPIFFLISVTLKYSTVLSDISITIVVKIFKMLFLKKSHPSIIFLSNVILIPNLCENRNYMNLCFSLMNS